MRTAIAGAVLGAFTSLGCPAAWAGPAAEAVLKATGLRGGLVVQLGCDEGELTAAFGAAGAFSTDPIANHACGPRLAFSHPNC